MATAEVVAWQKAVFEEHKKTAGTGGDSATHQLHNRPMCQVFSVPMGDFKQTLIYTFVKIFEGVDPWDINDAVNNIYTDFTAAIKKKDFSKEGVRGVGKGWDYWIRDDNESYRDSLREDKAAAMLAHPTDVVVIIGKYEGFKNWKKLSSNSFFIQICKKYTTGLKGQDLGLKQKGSAPDHLGKQDTRYDKELRLLGGVQVGEGSSDKEIYKNQTGFHGEMGDVERGGIGSSSIRMERISEFVETGEIEFDGKMIKAPLAVKEVMREAKKEYKKGVKYDVKRKHLLNSDGSKEIDIRFVPRLTLLGAAANQKNKGLEEEYTALVQKKINKLAEIACGGSAELAEAIILYNMKAKNEHITTTGQTPQRIAKSEENATVTGEIKETRVISKRRIAGLTVAGVKKVTGGAARKTTTRARPGASNVPLEKIRMLINNELPNAVMDNMGAPRLTNRTGDFARSVNIDHVLRTKGKGFPSFAFTYQRDPYGVHEQDADFDPRKLIDASIREIAAKYAIGRFYTRRV